MYMRQKCNYLCYLDFYEISIFFISDEGKAPPESGAVFSGVWPVFPGSGGLPVFGAVFPGLEFKYRERILKTIKQLKQLNKFIGPIGSK